MREALPALAVASINKVDQYLPSSTKDSCSISATDPFSPHLAPQGHHCHLEPGRETTVFPQKSLCSSLNPLFWFCLWQFLFAASSRHTAVCVQPYCTLVIKEICADLICFCLLTAYSPLPLRKSEDKHKNQLHNRLQIISVVQTVKAQQENLIALHANVAWVTRGMRPKKRSKKPPLREE